MRTLLTLALGLCGLTACDEAATPPADPATLPSTTRLHHDFGAIRHGDSRTHVFVIPVPDGESDWIPVGFQRTCVCAAHRFIIEPAEADQPPRYPSGRPIGEFAVRDGETLKLELTIDTSTKEPAAQKSLVTPGQVVLQRELPPFAQHIIQLDFSFGIDAPIEVKPAATIDFGRMPRSIRFGRSYALRGVEGPVTYGKVRCVERDPMNPIGERDVEDVAHSLVMDGDEAKLELSFKPSETRPIGPFSMRVEIETDVPGGYRLVLPVSGIVIPDIELGPPGRLSFGQIDLTAQTAQQVMITDHDRTRAPEFYATKIVDQLGRDVRDHFTARFEPVPDYPRSRMLILEYAGNLSDVQVFRGKVHLAKSEGGDTIQTVDYVGFRRR